MGWLALALVLGFGAGAWWAGRRAPEPGGAPLERHPGIDVLRRAHRASVACVVFGEEPPRIAPARPAVDRAVVDRVVAITRLAASDGREQIVRDERDGSFVAAGSEGSGVGVVMDSPVAGPDRIDAVLDDLRCFLTELNRRALAPVAPSSGAVPGLDTLPAVASGLCHEAARIAGQPVLVAVRSAASGPVTVAAVSPGANPRWFGFRVEGDCTLVRAFEGEHPVIANTLVELLGPAAADRRQTDQGAWVVPVRGGGRAVGAIAVLEDRRGTDGTVREELSRLASRAGGAFAAAAAVDAAERKAETDPLTGLPNRVALQRAMGGTIQAAAVLAVDIDHFKRLNDTHGHAAGDAALRHVAETFRRALREEDLPARIGGEEFALWLPGTTLPTALEVGERVRREVEEGRFEWSGQRIPITCSIGAAAVPDTSNAVGNLLATADAALYRAKEGGRNRVVPAGPHRSG